jgi:neutral ceramidase
VLASPVDEFNAPVGAALCEGATAQFPSAELPGTSGLPAYGSCARLDVVGPVIAAVLGLEVDVDATHPICQTTRTTLSALRIDDHVIGTLPGEVSVLIADLVRATSPVDAAHTIVVGYAQGHVGYLLRPEDWVLGGYESSITFWGPLEAEYLAEQLATLMPLATTTAREDGAADGATRVATLSTTDTFPIDDPAPGAGTVPATVSPDVWVRSGTPATAQPSAQIARVGGLATFVWNGDDPAVKTPVVTLQREVGKGAFEDVVRRSGRTVRDGDLLLTYTPLPLNREGPQTHTWAVEWQAVPWLGAEGLDELADRGSLPLGRYRFHVAGDGWTLDSDPFEVVPGGLGAVASRAGTVLTVTATLSAPKGFRLLDLEAPSNRPVPLRQQTVTIELLAADVVLFSGSAETSDTGVVTVDRAEVTTATSVRITDSSGNTATTAL